MRHFIRKFFLPLLVFTVGVMFLLCCFEHPAAAQDQEFLWPSVGLFAERSPIYQYNVYPQFAGHYVASNFLSQSRPANIPSLFQSDFQIMSNAPTVFPAQSLSTAGIPTSLFLDYATQQEGIHRYSSEVGINTISYIISNVLQSGPGPLKALSMMTPQPLVDMITSHALQTRVFIPGHPTMFGWSEGGWLINRQDPVFHLVDPAIMGGIISDLEGEDVYHYYFY